MRVIVCLFVWFPSSSNHVLLLISETIFYSQLVLVECLFSCQIAGLKSSTEHLLAIVGRIHLCNWPFHVIILWFTHWTALLVMQWNSCSWCQSLLGVINLVLPSAWWHFHRKWPCSPQTRGYGIHLCDTCLPPAPLILWIWTVCGRESAISSGCSLSMSLATVSQVHPLLPCQVITLSPHFCTVMSPQKTFGPIHSDMSLVTVNINKL